MARGWESKEIESQIEAAEGRAARDQRTQLTPEQLRLERERDSIELSRTRVLQDIAAASNPGYIALLERSLSFLDEKLVKLAAGGKS